MSVVYRIKTERPSLDDVFWFEPREKMCFMSETSMVYNIFDDATGFIGYNIRPSITWEELEVRKNELRPDIRADINYCTDYNKSSNPLFNPFELLTIAEFNFENFENFNNAYSKKFIEGETAIALSNLWTLLYTEANNTVTEEVIVDGVKIDYSTRFN